MPWKRVALAEVTTTLVIYVIERAAWTKQNLFHARAGSIVNAFPLCESSCWTSWQSTSCSDVTDARMKESISEQWSWMKPHVGRCGVSTDRPLTRVVVAVCLNTADHRRLPQITTDHRRSPDSLLLADDLITYIRSPKIRKQVVQRWRI